MLLTLKIATAFIGTTAFTVWFAAVTLFGY